MTTNPNYEERREGHEQMRIDIAVIKNTVLSCTEIKKQVRKNKEDILCIKTKQNGILWTIRAVALGVISLIIKTVFKL